MTPHAREEIARVLEIVADDGLPNPRDLDVALDAIQATLALNPDWEPIENAPKDGTPILACRAGSAFHPTIMHCEDGQFGWLNNDLGFIIPDAQPTHFMALPKVPTA